MSTNERRVSGCLWTNERADLLYLHTGVKCQISKDLEPALTMREFCENPQKSCDTRTLTLIVLEQEGAVCQSCEGPDDNDVMVIIDQGLSDNVGHLMQ